MVYMKFYKNELEISKKFYCACGEQQTPEKVCFQRQISGVFVSVYVYYQPV